MRRPRRSLHAQRSVSHDSGVGDQWHSAGRQRGTPGALRRAASDGNGAILRELTLLRSLSRQDSAAPASSADTEVCCGDVIKLWAMPVTGPDDPSSPLVRAWPSAPGPTLTRTRSMKAMHKLRRAVSTRHIGKRGSVPAFGRGGSASVAFDNRGGFIGWFYSENRARRGEVFCIPPVDACGVDFDSENSSNHGDQRQFTESEFFVLYPPLPSDPPLDTAHRVMQAVAAARATPRARRRRVRYGTPLLLFDQRGYSLNARVATGAGRYITRSVDACAYIGPRPVGTPGELTVTFTRRVHVREAELRKQRRRHSDQLEPSGHTSVSGVAGISTDDDIVCFGDTSIAMVANTMHGASLPIVRYKRSSSRVLGGYLCHGGVNEGAVQRFELYRAPTASATPESATLLATKAETRFASTSAAVACPTVSAMRLIHLGLASNVHVGESPRVCTFDTAVAKAINYGVEVDVGTLRADDSDEADAIAVQICLSDGGTALLAPSLIWQRVGRNRLARHRHAISRDGISDTGSLDAVAAFDVPVLYECSSDTSNIAAGQRNSRLIVRCVTRQTRATVAHAAHERRARPLVAAQEPGYLRGTQASPHVGMVGVESVARDSAMAQSAGTKEVSDSAAAHSMSGAISDGSGTSTSTRSEVATQAAATADGSWHQNIGTLLCLGLPRGVAGRRRMGWSVLMCVLASVVGHMLGHEAVDTCLEVVAAFAAAAVWIAIALFLPVPHLPSPNPLFVDTKGQVQPALGENWLPLTVQPSVSDLHEGSSAQQRGITSHGSGRRLPRRSVLELLCGEDSHLIADEDCNKSSGCAETQGCGTKSGQSHTRHWHVTVLAWEPQCASVDAIAAARELRRTPQTLDAHGATEATGANGNKNGASSDDHSISPQHCDLKRVFTSAEIKQLDERRAGESFDSDTDDSEACDAGGGQRGFNTIQRCVLRTMRDQLGDELGGNGAITFPEVTGPRRLLRFLRGHKYDIETACAMTRAMLQWRCECAIVDVNAVRNQIVGGLLPQFFGAPTLSARSGSGASLRENIEQVTERAMASEAAAAGADDVSRRLLRCHPFVFGGTRRCDRHGRPLLIERSGRVQPKLLLSTSSLDEFLRFHVYHMEHIHLTLDALSLREGELVRCVAIKDLAGFGLHLISAQGISWLRSFVKMTQDNYPETVHKCYIVNAPWAFSSIWSIIKPWLAERTIKKVEVLGKDYQAVLEREIESKCLPLFLGGSWNSPLDSFDMDGAKATADSDERGDAIVLGAATRQEAIAAGS